MARYWRNIQNGFEALSRFFGTLASYMIIILISFLTINVLMRYLVNRPFSFTEEMTGYMLCFIVFIGLAYTIQAGAHVITNILIRHLPQKVVNILDFIKICSGVVFGGVLLYAACQLTIKNYARDTVAFGALDTPVWIPNSIFLFGSLLFEFQLIVLLLKAIKGEH